MVSRFQISDRDSPVDPLFEIVLTKSQIIFRLLTCHGIQDHVTKTIQRRNGQIYLSFDRNNSDFEGNELQDPSNHFLLSF